MLREFLDLGHVRKMKSMIESDIRNNKRLVENMAKVFGKEMI